MKIKYLIAGALIVLFFAAGTTYCLKAYNRQQVQVISSEGKTWHMGTTMVNGTNVPGAVVSIRSGASNRLSSAEATTFYTASNVVVGTNTVIVMTNKDGKWILGPTSVGGTNTTVKIATVTVVTNGASH